MYRFNQENILEIQRIKKYELAFFYGVTPQHFRRELANLFILPNKKRYYSTEEVEKIFAAFGSISKFDVENAAERIKGYIGDIHELDKIRYLK